MIRSTLIAATLLAGASMPAFAQEFTAVQTIEKMTRIQQEDGTVSVEFSAADRVVPGEDLYYQLTYDNATSDDADNVSLVMAVPAEVVYSENSVVSEDANASIAFSTDGGGSYAPRGELTVSQDGEPRPAVSQDITHIRWTFNEPIAAGNQGAVGFSAVVR